MKRRTIVVLFVAALLFVALPAVWWAHRTSELDRYRRVIESKFSAQFLLIEQKSLELMKDKSDSRTLNRRKVEVEFRAALSVIPEIYSASWSADGHHGQGVLRTMPDGITITSNPLIYAQSEDGLHCLYYGKTDTNIRLLVYEGRVPNGEQKVYQVEFRYDDIIRISQNQ